MRLVIIPISTFGAIGPSGHPFISELSRRMRASIPYSLLSHASWATPRVGPMIRTALTHAVRRGLAAAVHTHCWRCGDGSRGMGVTTAAATGPAVTAGLSRADRSFWAWLRPGGSYSCSSVTVLVCIK